MANKVYYIMGVSGSGKSTVGKMLADELNCLFFDGDDMHPASNVAKMKSGQALNDEDRKPWLADLSKLATEHVKLNSVVIVCSALKEKYRKLLQNDIGEHCEWVYLKGNSETILKRMQNRDGHFMPASLLDSQFDTLEEPDYGIHVNIDNSPKDIIKFILQNS